MEKTNSPHVLLFTGHMIDRTDRATPRFPADQEAVARRAIAEAVEQQQARTTRPLTGIAGGASGGDLLFHEVCETHAIPTEVYLALPPDAYLEASVSFAGAGWVERFERLLDRRPTHVLAGADPEDGSIWARTNLWMLDEAVARGGEHLTLIALWNGQAGDGPGGTEDMVRRVEAQGGRSIILDTNDLFGL